MFSQHVLFLRAEREAPSGIFFEGNRKQPHPYSGRREESLQKAFKQQTRRQHESERHPYQNEPKDNNKNSKQVQELGDASRGLN